VLHNPNAVSGRGAIAKFHIKRDTTSKIATVLRPRKRFIYEGKIKALIPVSGIYAPPKGKR
jgi:hypothetical protein